MSTCSKKVLRESKGFGNMLIKNPDRAEELKVAYISTLSALHSAQEVGSIKYVAKVIEASLSVPYAVYRGIDRQTTIKKLDSFIQLNKIPDDQIAANFALLGDGITSAEGIVDMIKEGGNMETVSASTDIGNITHEITLASDSDIAYNVIKNTEVRKDVSVKDAENFMAVKKNERIELVEGIKRDSPDMWGAFLKTYFPTSNKLGVDFTEWVRNNFFDLVVDFGKTDDHINAGFVRDIDKKVKIYKSRLESELEALSTTSYGDTDSAFLDNLLSDMDIVGVRRRYYISVLLNDFDFILENLVKIISLDVGKTHRENFIVDGFESDNVKIESKLLNIDRKTIQLFDKVPKTKNRLSLKSHIDPTIHKLSTTTDAFLSDNKLATGTFYHILGSDEHYFRNSKGANILLDAKKFYSYDGTSDRNTNSIDHYVNPLSNSSRFINNLMPLLRVVGSNGALGRRMGVADFVAIAPLLVSIEPTVAALTAKLKEISDTESTKIGSIARSLHAYIFSDRAIYNKDINSIYSASKNIMFRNMNDDIVNAMFSALISKHHVRYLKVEEGRTTATKGPNKGSEGLIIDEALSGYLMDVNRYTKKNIINKIQVVPNDIMIDIGEDSNISISKVDTVDPYGDSPGMRAVAMHIGLEDLYNDIASTYADSYKASDIDRNVIDTFKKIIQIAATNAENFNDRLSISRAMEKSTERVPTHKDYMYLSPSTLIKGNDQKNLADVFFVDSSKAQRIGDKTTQSSTTPNKNTSISRQVKTIKKFNDEKVTPTDMSHIPFILEAQQEGSNIVPASIEDVFIKAPIVYDGNVVGLSDWDVNIRLEHAMVEGFLEAPKRDIGRKFYLQATNYSDKSSPEMFGVIADKNLLSTSTKIQSLRDAYIEYNYRKNEAIQRVTLTSFREFIVGDFESIRRKIGEDAAYFGVDPTSRYEALIELKDLLLDTDFNAETGDMIKPFNEILKRVNISPTTISESNADLDQDADYVTFGSNRDVIFLKPTAGIRAELFRDVTKANRLVKHYIKGTKALLTETNYKKGSLENYSVNKSRIEGILARKAGITNNFDDFVERFFLINGIYGHALKTITMGDETYFAGRFGGTIDSYYEKADVKLNSTDDNLLEESGLESVSKMLTAQFKRAQSILTRGVLYAQKGTIQGLRKTTNRDNLLQHLDIYEGRGEVVDGKRQDIYRFKDLEGLTLTELWGKGVIAPLKEGTHILETMSPSGGRVVKLNIGRDQVVFSTDLKEMSQFIPNVIPVELAVGIKDLLENRIKAEDSSISANRVDKDSKETLGNVLPDVVSRRDVSLTIKKIKEFRRTQEINKGEAITIPDFVPSILITDPESYVNLLSKAGVGQENSDGIQYIHPLYELITRHARGNSIGAFTTQDYNASKMLNTSVEYGKNRQTLLKNSTQMPFSMAQMSKIGSIELFNTFKKLNTAIEFTKNYLTYTQTIGKIEVVDKKLLNTRINNLDDLFAYFGGYGKQGDAAWDQVLEVLRQNPTEMYNFVGIVNVPSAQKTGRKRINKFENVFSREADDIHIVPDVNNVEGRDFVTTPDLNIDYISNEFNYEILTKEHGYDVSGKINKRSSLALLSQLVNAISFGGLSDVNAMSLQNAMGGRMSLNRLKVGRDLALVARQLAANPTNPDYTPNDYETIIQKLHTGDVSTDDYTDSQKVLFEDILRMGVYNMAQLAFNESADSALIRDIIKGEGYSLDTPAIQNKVMGTLRSAFFGETVKMRMEGFQAVVTTTHKTSNIYNFNGGRKARGAYILAALHADDTHNWEQEEGELVNINTASGEQISDIQQFVLPMDKVKISTKRVTYNKEGDVIYSNVSDNITYRNSVNIDNYIGASGIRIEDPATEAYSITEKTLYAVLTPDARYDDLIEPSEDGSDVFMDYDIIPEQGLVKIRTGLSSFKTYYKWYLEELYSKEEIGNKILAGALTEDITEKYSLQWMKLTREQDGETIDFLSSEDYKNFYREMMEDDNITDEDVARLRAGIILESQRTHDDGSKVWSMTPAEVILPAFMKERFGLLKEVSLHEMLGHSTNIDTQKVFLKNYLLDITPRGKRYALLTQGEHYSKMVTRIYASRAIVERSPWYDKILKYLQTTEKAYVEATVAANPGMDPHDVPLSQSAIQYINSMKNEAFDKHVTELASSFMDMLDTVLTRIPGQSKQSGFVGRVVEFLDAQGNASFAPTEHLVTTGGDYDIDTLSVLTRTMDAEGKLYDNTDFIEDGVFSFALMEEKYGEEIKDVMDSVDSYIDEYNTEADDYVSKLESDIKKAKIDSPKNVPTLEKRLGFAKTNHINDDKRLEIVTSIVSEIHKKYENILSNTIAGSMINSLNSVDTAVELNTPMTMSMFGPIIERLEKKFGKAATFGMSGETFWPIFKSEELAAQGKEAIGMYATVLKINSAIQAAKMNYAKYKKDHKSDDRDPFIFDHSITFKRDGKSVTRDRKGFADLDRFKINKMAANDLDTQRKLEDLYKGNSEYKTAALPTLVGMMEEEISTAMNHYLKIQSPFTYEQKQNLLDAFGEEAGTNTFDERFLLFIKEKLNQKGELSRDFLDPLGAAIGMDMSAAHANQVRSVKSKIDKSLIRPTDKNIRVLSGIIQSSFGIDIPVEVIKSNTPIFNIKAYLTNNPNVVEQAYINIIGKQLSNDVQSQFLSAATDNAKELYLGKIRSSSLTNPVITTMMILGYEVDDIIDFLYDPNIEKILIHFSEEKRNLRRVSLSSKAVSDMEGVSSGSKNSLISLLQIGEQITKFRDVRSLNENAKIEQASLDKILQNVDSKKLYKAIITDNFSMLAIDAGAKEKVRVLNPEQMIFLHPQSRDLFINLYESEVYKMPALFRTVLEVAEQAGDRGRDPLVYKNIKTALAALKVEDFLKTKVVTKDGSTQTRLGEVMFENEDGTFDTNKIDRIPLDNPFNRERFVHEFPKYLRYARSIIKENEGLESITSTNTFRSVKSVLAIPKLKNSNVDSATASLIQDGFRELKSLDLTISKKPNETDEAFDKRTHAQLDMNSFKVRLYNNLSLYALIVSKGEVRKGSMIEMFDEIVFELGKHLSGLSQDYYRDVFRTTEPVIQTVINGKIPTYNTLLAEHNNEFGNTFSMEDSDDSQDSFEDDRDSYLGADIEGFDGDQDFDEDYASEVGFRTSKQTSYGFDSKITEMVVGDMVTEGQVFRVLDPKLKDAIFYAPVNQELAIRIFDIVADEALPHTTNSSFNAHSAISFADKLGLAGKQIGYKIKYEGEDAWILAYAGESTADNVDITFETYQVYSKGKKLRVPSVFLMKQNPDLFLKGNIIEAKNARNIRAYDAFKESVDVVYNLIPKTVGMEEFNLSRSKAVDGMFTQQEWLDPIVKVEARLLFTRAGAVIKVRDNGLGTYTNSFDTFMEDADVPSANVFVRNPLVPSLKIPKGDTNSVEENALIPEIQSKASDMINSLSLNSSMVFHGMLNSGQLKAESDDYKLKGGINMIQDLLAPFRDGKKKKGKLEKDSFTILDGAFKIQRTLNSSLSSHEYKVTRKKEGEFIVMVDKNPVSLHVDTETGAITAAAKGVIKTISVNKAIDKGYSKIVHKKVSSTVEGVKREIMKVDFVKGPQLIVKLEREGYNDRLYKLRPVTETSKGIVDKYATYYVDQKEFDRINTEVEESNKTPDNLKCNS